MGVGSASTQEGLIGYCPYDGDTLGYSGLDSHGTVFGNPTFVGSKVGSGDLDFDGDDDVRIDSVADDITSNENLQNRMILVLKESMVPLGIVRVRV